MSEQNGKQDDPLLVAGALVVLLYIVILILWSVAHEQISMVHAYIRYAEVWILDFVAKFIDIPGLNQIREFVDKTCTPDDSIVSKCYKNFGTVKWNEITSSAIYFNLFFLIFVVIICVRMFLYTERNHPFNKFRKTHNIKSFVAENAEEYPHLKIFQRLNLIDKPLTDPLFGMQETSRQFCYRKKLISGWKEEVDQSYLPILDRDKTFLILKNQLGRHWTKSTDLSPGETILAAIVMPRVAATDATLSDDVYHQYLKDSEEIVNWCWEIVNNNIPDEEQDSDYSWLKPDFNLARPREIILKYIGSKPVQKILEKHAFVRTVLFGLFLQARRLGVLPPAEVRWLRFYDRELWYFVQNYGRYSGHSEGCAGLSHFLYESKQGLAIPEPQIDKSVNGLEAALTSYRFTREDKEAYEKEAVFVERSIEPIINNLIESMKDS